MRTIDEIKAFTKHKIKDEYIKRLLENDIDLISIQSLCEAAMISRTTFYSYYGNTDDVRTDIERDLVSHMPTVQSVPTEYEPELFRVYILTAFSYFKSESELTRALLIKHRRLDYEERIRVKVSEEIKRMYNTNLPYFAIAADMLASIFVCALISWFQNPKSIPVETLITTITVAEEALYQNFLNIEIEHTANEVLEQNRQAYLKLAEQ